MTPIEFKQAVKRAITVTTLVPCRKEILAAIDSENAVLECSSVHFILTQEETDHSVEGPYFISAAIEDGGIPDPKEYIDMCSGIGHTFTETDLGSLLFMTVGDLIEKKEFAKERIQQISKALLYLIRSNPERRDARVVLIHLTCETDNAILTEMQYLPIAT